MMLRHEDLENKGGRLLVYFADPHSPSPRQRPTNANANGLLRQYFPKWLGLSEYSQQHLTWVVEELINCLGKALGF